MLDVLAHKYKTDKASSEHQYISTYEALFKETRLKVKKVVEIGIHKGASLKMWAEYFPFAKVYGIDIIESKLIQEGNIRSFKADQGNREELIEAIKEIGDEVNLIVDDGSHDLPDQVTSMEMLWPCLKKGGLYIIEDFTMTGKEGLLIYRK